MQRRNQTLTSGIRRKTPASMYTASLKNILGKLLLVYEDSPGSELKFTANGVTLGSCTAQYHLQLTALLGCPFKKGLFPVQRVAKIVASRAAAFLFHFFFGGGGGGVELEKIIHFLGKKNCKKISSRTFFSHPANKPET